MKISKLLLLVLVFLVFCGNAYAMDMSSAQPSIMNKHCNEAHGDTATSSEDSTKETGSSTQMKDHNKGCKSKECSMKTCCFAPALNASFVISLNVYFTFSNLPVIIERVVLDGSKDTIYHPPHTSLLV